MSEHDCEECGAEGEGYEWELTDELLCYDCAKVDPCDKVPQEWYIDDRE